MDMTRTFRAMQLDQSIRESQEYTEHIAIPASLEDEFTQYELLSLTDTWKLESREMVYGYFHGFMMFHGYSMETENEMNWLRQVYSFREGVFK